MNIRIEQLNLQSNRILVLRDAKSEIVSAGGLITVTTVTAPEPNTGIVKSIGNDCTFVKVGDRVMFSPYNNSPGIDICGTNYLLMAEPEVVSTINPL